MDAFSGLRHRCGSCPKAPKTAAGHARFAYPTGSQLAVAQARFSYRYTATTDSTCKRSDLGSVDKWSITWERAALWGAGEVRGTNPRGIYMCLSNRPHARGTLLVFVRRDGGPQNLNLDHIVVQERAHMPNSVA